MSTEHPLDFKIQGPLDISAQTFSPESWEKLIGIDRIKLRIKLPVSGELYIFPDLPLSIGHGISGPCLAHYDQGRPVALFYYENGSPRPTKEISYSYRIDCGYKHPLRSDPLHAVKVLAKAWECDAYGKRLNKFGLSVWHGVYGDVTGENSTRPFTVYSESEYRLFAYGSDATAGHDEYREVTRKFPFTGRHTIIYNSVIGFRTDGELHLAKNGSDKLWSGVELPESLGAADIIFF